MKQMLMRGLSLGVVMLSTAACVTRAQYDRLVTEYHAENQARLKAEGELQRQQGDMTGMRQQLEDAQAEAIEVGRLSEERIRQLEDALADARARFSFVEPGMEVFLTSEGFTILMQDKLLFDSGSTDLKDSGVNALNAIAKELVTKGYREVRIDGHTDTDPINKTRDRYPRGNHELAAARALTVYDHLVKKGSVKSDVLSVAAYGPNRPLADNASAAGKARNRRVEIHVRVPETPSN